MLNHRDGTTTPELSGLDHQANQIPRGGVGGVRNG